MPVGRTHVATGGEPHLPDRTGAHRPHPIGPSRHDLALWGHRPHLRRGPDELCDRNASSIRELDQRVAGHTLPEIRELGALVLPALGVAVELRDGDHRDVELLRQELQPA